MKNADPQFHDKIVNLHLARTAMHGAEAFGEFRVIVRLARPGKLPSYMKAAGLHSPGHIKARIACNQIQRVGRDPNIVSVELREHVIQ